jgi:hypothetical protein
LKEQKNLLSSSPERYKLQDNLVGEPRSGVSQFNNLSLVQLQSRQQKSIFSGVSSAEKAKNPSQPKLKVPLPRVGGKQKKTATKPENLNADLDDLDTP